MLRSNAFPAQKSFLAPCMPPLRIGLGGGCPLQAIPDIGRLHSAVLYPMYYDRPRKRGKAQAEPAQKPKKPPKPAKKQAKPARVPPPKRKKQQDKRNKQREKRNNKHILLKFVALLLVLALLAGGGLYIMPLDTFGSHTAYGAVQKLPSGCVHVLLIGLDLDGNNTSRSDTMMVLSIGKGGVKLTSLQRDTGVYIEGYNGLRRLNAAYAYGGEEGLIRTVNGNFGFDLSRWATVDYDSFPEIIDSLGGVRISGISDDEAAEINSNMKEQLLKKYRAGKMSQEEVLKTYYANELACGGDYVLSGMQALGYARIRKTDSDYGRTNRQRKVVSACVSKLKSFDPVTLIRFFKPVKRSVRTNMGTLELLSLGEKALFAGGITQMRLPVNGTYRDDGGMFYDVDYNMNREAFISFVYGER